MAREHGDAVRGGLALKKAGNDIDDVAGRARNPSGECAGRRLLPRADPAEFAAAGRKIETGARPRRRNVRWVARFPFPDYERDYEFVALRHPDEYPIIEGRIVSNRGLDIAVGEYDSHFEERHVAHSTSLHSVLKRRGSYLVGPLARYALNFDRLPRRFQALAREAGLGPVCRNPFQSIIVRAVEVVYACDESLRIIAAYREPDAPAIALEPRAGVGHGCTEAPRGLIYHRYEIAADGSVVSARIVPPTSQNQLAIEEDLCAVASTALDLPDDALRDKLRADDPQLRSLHLLLVSLSQAGGASDMTKRKRAARRSRRCLVVGIGNPDRGDDGVGPLVVRQVAERLPPDLARHVGIIERTGDALALIDDWAGRDAVVLVDASAPVSAAGRVHRIDLLEDRLPDEISLSSTHAFGVAAAVGLARTLGLLPRRVIVYAVEGEQFIPGAPISAAVAAAAAGVASLVADEVAGLLREPVAV